MSKAASRCSSCVFSLRFKKFFEADENGVPCYWPGMSQDKISAAYSRAKKIADQLIPLLSHLDFDFKILFDQPDMIDESHKSNHLRLYVRTCLSTNIICVPVLVSCISGCKLLLSTSGIGEESTY